MENNYTWLNEPTRFPWLKGSVKTADRLYSGEKFCTFSPIQSDNKYYVCGSVKVIKGENKYFYRCKYHENNNNKSSWIDNPLPDEIFSNVRSRENDKLMYDTIQKQKEDFENKMNK